GDEPDCAQYVDDFPGDQVFSIDYAMRSDSHGAVQFTKTYHGCGFPDPLNGAPPITETKAMEGSFTPDGTITFKDHRQTGCLTCRRSLPVNQVFLISAY